jgi:hypothetical protein
MEIWRAFVVLCILSKFIREGWHFLQFLKASSVKTTRVHVLKIKYLDCHIWYLHNLFNYTIRKDSLMILHNIYFAIQPHKIIFGIATYIQWSCQFLVTKDNLINRSENHEIYMKWNLYRVYWKYISKSTKRCF